MAAVESLEETSPATDPTPQNPEFTLLGCSVQCEKIALQPSNQARHYHSTAVKDLITSVAQCHNGKCLFWEFSGVFLNGCRKKQRAGTCTDLRQLNPFVIFLAQRVTLNYNSGNISGKVT